MLAISESIDASSFFKGMMRARLCILKLNDYNVAADEMAGIKKMLGRRR
jgi:hypothetical protein